MARWGYTYSEHIGQRIGWSTRRPTIHRSASSLGEEDGNVGPPLPKVLLVQIRDRKMWKRVSDGLDRIMSWYMAIVCVIVASICRFTKNINRRGPVNTHGMMGMDRRRAMNPCALPLLGLETQPCKGAIGAIHQVPTCCFRCFRGVDDARQHYQGCE